jgi:signal transduction histidine kinase
VARRTSISLPITLGVITVGLSIAMLVGWIVVILQNSALTREVAQNTWLLFAGTISLGVIISVLVLFSVFLVRETLEIRRQDSFIDSVTHELKSPLASLKLFLETLGRAELAQAKREELRQMMLDDVERLSSFIDDVLDASRLTHGRQSLARSEVDVGALVEACADVVRKRYRLQGPEIQVQVAGPLRLFTDRTALETVCRNLLDNAVKYSDTDIAVRLHAELRGREVVIEVQDRGIGIPPEHVKRVFERFYRVPTEAVRARRGTGLGLFVVSALVRALHGHLDATSPGAGQGTTLRVSLPARYDRERP